MSKIPSDDILESLYKLRIRGSAQLKTVLELYDMETQPQEENESGGANDPNGRPIFPWKTHCVFDLQIFSGNWSTWSCSWLLRSIQYHFARRFRISITARIKFFYQPVKFPLTAFWKVCTRDERESRQLVRAFVARFSLQSALSSLVTRPRPLTTRMSPEVQGHRPARPHEIFTPETNELKQEYW